MQTVMLKTALNKPDEYYSLIKFTLLPSLETIISHFQRFEFNSGVTTQEIKDFFLFKQYFLHL